MTTEAKVVHLSATRCRLRLAHMRGDAVFFERLRLDLAELARGTDVTVNATTGSVLLRGRQISIDDIRAFGEERGWFVLNEVEQHGQSSRSAKQGRDPLDSRTTRYALTGLFLTLAAVQLARGQILVPATSFLWYALAANALPADAE